MSDCEERRGTDKTTEKATYRGEDQQRKAKRKMSSPELFLRPGAGEKLDPTPGERRSLEEETGEAASNRRRRNRRRSFFDLRCLEKCVWENLFFVIMS